MHGSLPGMNSLHFGVVLTDGVELRVSQDRVARLM